MSIHREKNLYLELNKKDIHLHRSASRKARKGDAFIATAEKEVVRKYSVRYGQVEQEGLHDFKE